MPLNSASHPQCKTLRWAASTLTALLLAVTPVYSRRLLQEPLVLPCGNQDDITLEVRVSRWDIGPLAFTTRAYNYKGVDYIPGPTIEMYPGEQCNITIVNKLPDLQGPDCNYHVNALHCPDTTNLHTHGLHVSPDQDAVYTHVLPGESLLYTYDIPEDHLAGTHWYHAHHHGSVTLQVMGGLVGALIVQPGANYVMPSDLAELYKLALVLVLQHINFAGQDPYQPVNGSFGLRDYEGIAESFENRTEYTSNTVPPEVEQLPFAPEEFYLVNGQYQPTITVQANKPVLLRMINAVATRVLELELMASGCTMYLIARDGVFQYAPYPELPNGIAFTQGSRADVMVVCDATMVGQTVAISSVPADSRAPAFGTENRFHQDTILSLVVEAPPAGSEDVSISDLVPTSQAPLPEYLADLSNVEAQYGARLVFGGGQINSRRFPGFDADISDRYLSSFCLNETYDLYLGNPGTSLPLPKIPNLMLNTASGARIPFGVGDPKQMFHIRHFLRAYSLPPLNKIHGKPEQTESNNNNNNKKVLSKRKAPEPATGAHSYHHHVNHFQVALLNDGDYDVGIIRPGEWRDVVPVLPKGIRMRFRPLHFTGEMVLHCHILEHEDLGMMGLYNIQTC